MLKIVGAVLRFLFPVSNPLVQMKPALQFAGDPTHQHHWFRKKGVLWFNGYPGVPKLPLVQRRPRPSASSSLNPVASFTPDEEEGVELEEDPEPLV